jgi:hypothetical protein
LGKLKQGIYNNSVDPIANIAEFDDCEGLTLEEINAFYGFDSNGEPLDSFNADLENSEEEDLEDSDDEDDPNNEDFEQGLLDGDEDIDDTGSDPISLGHDFDTEVSLYLFL